MRAHSLLLLMLVNPLAAAGAQRPAVSQEIERALSDTRRELGEIRVSLAPLSAGLAGVSRRARQPDRSGIACGTGGVPGSPV